VYLCSSYCVLICRTWGQGRERRKARPLKLSRYEAKLAMIVCAALRQCSVLSDLTVVRRCGGSGASSITSGGGHVLEEAS